MELEDERHALTVCPLYEDRRQLIRTWLVQNGLALSSTDELWRLIVEGILDSGRTESRNDDNLLLIISKFLYFVLKDANEAYHGTLLLFRVFCYTLVIKTFTTTFFLLFYYSLCLLVYLLFLN